MDAKDRPTKKQRELLAFIENFIAQHGYGPSYREIMRLCGYKSVSTVATHVENLIKKGHLRKKDRSARSLEICSIGQKIISAEEKWLVKMVTDKIEQANNANLADLKKLDILVKAVKILGLSSADGLKNKLALLQNQEEA